jgi:hypothetical protein
MHATVRACLYLALCLHQRPKRTDEILRWYPELPIVLYAR